MVSNEEILKAQKKIHSTKVESRPIADRVLAIHDSKELSGVWSPVLCANGILKWRNDSQSYNLIPLGNCESIYLNFSLIAANLSISCSILLLGISRERESKCC
jgi:hypothetical protein